MKKLAKVKNKLSQIFSCPPTITPTPICEVEEPIFTQEEFEALLEELTEANCHLEEVIELAIEVRKTGKFTKKDKKLLDRFDEAVNNYR